MPVAMIIGATGQDGKLLTEWLSTKGYDIFGASRGFAHWNKDAVQPVDITQDSEVRKVVALYQPDEIYYFPAYHASSEERFHDYATLIGQSLSIHVHGCAHFLEAIRLEKREAKFFYAGSSRIFGKKATGIYNENSPPAPDCVYGLTKLAGMHLGQFYRNEFDLKLYSGILFNHESVYRKSHFLSRKLVLSAMRIAQKKDSLKVRLGNLDAGADWIHARDTIRAIWMMLQSAPAGEYVVASGQAHSVRDFAETCFSLLGFDWRDYVEVDPDILRENRDILAGDSSRLNSATGWKPEWNFRQMIRQLIIDEGGEDLLQ